MVWYGTACQLLSFFLHGTSATKTIISSCRTRSMYAGATGTDIHHEPVLGPDVRIPALETIPRRDATLHHQRGRVRDEDHLEGIHRSGPFTVHDYGAGPDNAGGGEVGGTVPALKVQGVGADEEVVEGCVAVVGLDSGGVRLRVETDGLDGVGGA